MGTIVFLLICCGICFTLACDPNARPVCSGSNGQICATFHKTFHDSCAMEAELSRLAQEGFHFKNSHNGDCCPLYVPAVLRSVCASDGKRYSNESSMDIAACRNRDYLTMVAPNTCSGHYFYR
ncbi:hypothetical protein RRG08_002277 [Elysia crispata]|uniref:Kazal-like domain-containing protein n=1 Tax=Elysia crispata TaxID=231223 RepID=A0AAE1DD20_9GAST|nr:hypothetical protein RRG08_002277 [Elysia crispata]